MVNTGGPSRAFFVRVSIPPEVGGGGSPHQRLVPFYSDYRHAGLKPLSPVVSTDAGYTTLAVNGRCLHLLAFQGPKPGCVLYWQRCFASSRVVLAVPMTARRGPPRIADRRGSCVGCGDWNTGTVPACRVVVSAGGLGVGVDGEAGPR